MTSVMTSAAVAALALSFATPAYADCAEEIAALKSQQFTGSIQSADATATKAIGPTATISDATKEIAASPEEVADQPTAQPAEVMAAAKTDAIGPTAAISDSTKEIATSPKEVANQPTAQPAEVMANADQLAKQAAGGSPGSFTSGGQSATSIEVLAARAEAYKNLGNEAACMNVIEQAKAS